MATAPRPSEVVSLSAWQLIAATAVGSVAAGMATYFVLKHESTRRKERQERKEGGSAPVASAPAAAKGAAAAATGAAAGGSSLTPIAYTEGLGPAKHILVTGGAGFIGSHTVVELLEAGYRVTVVDSLVNASAESIKRVIALTKKAGMVSLIVADLCDEDALDRVFKTAGHFDACIHFAGLKAVGESVAKPVLYYNNNLVGTFNLIDAMRRHGCSNLVFSSSATVYGNAEIPYTEGSKTGSGVTNPYGRTKYFIEEVLQDVARTEWGSKWGICILRYFNPVGAHASGQLGEDPNGIPNNLMPYIAQVCVGRREKLTVFGDDYDTADGTGERDYIHVVDLAKGHVASLRYLESHVGTDAKAPGVCEVFNLGSGKPTSVLQLVKAMEVACGKPIPREFGARRAGDLPCFYADTGKAAELLGWRTELSVADMCADTWRWQSKNPQGFATPKE
jgi:UDP-glucose 4-epimerase